MDLISVIVPVYNIEKYLERCLESIVSQSYEKLEVILVDDGSKDYSSVICDKYCEKYSNFKVIHKENAGLGYARNSGIEATTGKYITFIDGDDFLDVHRIERMYQRLIQTNSDTCLAGYSRVLNNGEIIARRNIYDQQIFEGDDIKKSVLTKMCGKKHDLSDYIEMSVCMVLFSNEIIQQNELRFKSEREYISEDLIFGTDYYRYAKRVCFSTDTGYYYCDNEGSLTTRYRADRFELQKKMYYEMEKRTKELGIYDLCEQRLITTFISIVRYCIKLEEKFSFENGRKNAKNNVRIICQDALVKEVLKKYNNGLVPIKSRMVNELIKRENVNLLYCIMHIKNKWNI